LYERELEMNETLRYYELAPPSHLRPYIRCVWRLIGPPPLGRHAELTQTFLTG
jgi:hypothetical protein